MAGEETVYLAGIPIKKREGESLEDARTRYNEKAMDEYRKKIEKNFWKELKNG